MIKLNIHEAKIDLSAYLDRLAQGEIIILCKRNVPIAEIRPLPPPRETSRPLGIDEGKFVAPPEFFEPLPADLLARFGAEAP